MPYNSVLYIILIALAIVGGITILYLGRVVILTLSGNDPVSQPMLQELYTTENLKAGTYEIVVIREAYNGTCMKLTALIKDNNSNRSAIWAYADELSGAVSKSYQFLARLIEGDKISISYNDEHQLKLMMYYG